MEWHANIEISTTLHHVVKLLSPGRISYAKLPVSDTDWVMNTKEVLFQEYDGEKLLKMQITS